MNNPGTGILTRKYARQDGQEYWAGRFILPNGKTAIMQAQVNDLSGYQVKLSEPGTYKTITDFHCPVFGQKKVQTFLTKLGKKMIAEQTVYRDQAAVKFILLGI